MVDSVDAEDCQNEDDVQEQFDDWGSESEELQEVEPAMETATGPHQKVSQKAWTGRP